MSEEPISWSVVTTARGPSDITLAFAAHHAAIGAAMVYVFLDDPDDPVAPDLKALPRVRVTACTDDHWARLGDGKRPERYEDRQKLNASHMLGKARGSWLLHAHTNEFLHIRQPLEDQVATKGDEAVWFRVPQLERVFMADATPEHVLQGLFRYPVPPGSPLIDEVYGAELGRFLHAGIAGEGRGRAFVPNTEGPVLTERALETEPGKRPPAVVAPGMALLRLEGLTPLEWAAQTLQLGEYPPEDLQDLRPERQAQIAYVRDTCRDLHEVLEFHRSLFTLNRFQARKLAAQGRIMGSPVDLFEPFSKRKDDATQRLAPRTIDEALGQKAAVLLMRKIREGMTQKAESPAA